MKLASVLLIGLALATTSLAERGVAVGEKAPEFELRDSSGKPHTLAALLGDAILAVLFFRSADW
jgi:cytochrome oxidase Cu insertion factor (SCO1/SenC/PrrC family)